MGDGDGEREDREAGAAGHADRGGDPDDRGGGESADGVTADEDQSAADESDPGDDLRGDAGGVEDHVGAEDVAESVFADEHEQRGAEADEGVGPQAGGFLSPFALQSDQRGKRERERELADLFPSLPGRHDRGESSRAEGHVVVFAAVPVGPCTAARARADGGPFRTLGFTISSQPLCAGTVAGDR